MKSPTVRRTSHRTNVVCTFRTNKWTDLSYCCRNLITFWSHSHVWIQLKRRHQRNVTGDPWPVNWELWSALMLVIRIAWATMILFYTIWLTPLMRSYLKSLLFLLLFACAIKISSPYSCVLHYRRENWYNRVIRIFTASNVYLIKQFFLQDTYIICFNILKYRNQMFQSAVWLV